MMNVLFKEDSLVLPMSFTVKTSALLREEQMLLDFYKEVSKREEQSLKAQLWTNSPIAVLRSRINSLKKAIEEASKVKVFSPQRLRRDILADFILRGWWQHLAQIGQKPSFKEWKPWRVREEMRNLSSALAQEVKAAQGLYKVALQKAIRETQKKQFFEDSIIWVNYQR